MIWTSSEEAQWQSIRRYTYGYFDSLFQVLWNNYQGYDGFWDAGLAPWDLAAGRAIIESAGGTVTDYRGAPHDLFGASTIASNGPIHAQLLAMVKRT